MSTEGVGPKANDSTDRLRQRDSDKEEGVHNPEYFADLIQVGPLSLSP